MKKIFMNFWISALFLGVSPVMGQETPKKTVTVAICKAVEHEALNTTAAGVRDYLNSRASAQNVTYRFLEETCQGNITLGTQIMEKFSQAKVDVVVTVGTTPTQCAYRIARGGKLKAVVFASVTNPADVSARLPEAQVTGVSNFVPLDPQVALFQEIQPNLKTLGILCNPGEPNSVAIVERLIPVCQKIGIVVKQQAIPRASDIPQAAEKLAQDVQAIFISNDNLALSAIPLIVSIASKRKIPVYVSDTDQVEKGCLASLGPNQYQLGKQAGRIVERIVEGESPNNIPVEYAQKEICELYVRTDGVVSIPEAVRKRAKKILNEKG
ncbi:MAG: ABC transporter substrate-binding protein [Holosporales bacterium]|jgi:putative ABC transport system substrate-binding protein|nr:ABC transporter substrate-binding protein [Holosporales bacterium]